MSQEMECEFTVVYAKLATCFRELGDFDKMLESAQLAVTKGPETSDNMVLLGEALVEVGK